MAERIREALGKVPTVLGGYPEVWTGPGRPAEPIGRDIGGRARPVALSRSARHDRGCSASCRDRCRTRYPRQTQCHCPAVCRDRRAMARGGAGASGRACDHCALDGCPRGARRLVREGRRTDPTRDDRAEGPCDLAGVLVVLPIISAAGAARGPDRAGYRRERPSPLSVLWACRSGHNRCARLGRHHDLAGRDCRRDPHQ